MSTIKSRNLSYRWGYVLTAFSLDLGLWAVVITEAVFHGIGYGLIYAQSIGGVLKVKTWLTKINKLSGK